ncbi:MAG: hypothetical protein LH474_00280 [Chamaesiphon sp.]|nr:hypothetical protein [Chamaesiphon sp.]
MAVKLEPQPVEPDTDTEDLMLGLFLDFITKDALTNPQNLEAYMAAMANEDDELLAGVVID